MEVIGNKLIKYIEGEERKDQYSCEIICVEVDLEIGLPEAINIAVANWSYFQELYYEQILFKCRICYGYGHFSRNCKKKSEEDIEREKVDQWTQV